MKLLIASQNNGDGGALATRLRAEVDEFSIMLVEDGENLLDAMRRANPDVVIVDMARPDRDGLDSLPLQSAGQVPPVVMFMDYDDPAFMREAIAAGMSTYHGRDVEPLYTKLIMRIALAFFQRTQQISLRLAEAEEQISARQTIDAAKRVLMNEDQMSEPAAHRFLRRRAMDQQKRIAEIAAGLLASRGKQGKNDG